jgi:hypothetical protein
MVRRYEVQMNTLCQGWNNVWSENSGDSDERPLNFASRKAAQDEIDKYLRDMKEAASLGHISDYESPEDFRILEIKVETKMKIATAADALALTDVANEVAAATTPSTKQLSCDNELLEPGSCEVCSSDIKL